MGSSNLGKVYMRCTIFIPFIIDTAKEKKTNTNDNNKSFVIDVYKTLLEEI